jgi:hypothetical protein
MVVTWGLAPPVICAWWAQSSGRWDLFERSGSITTAIGLIVASRRYLKYGISELALLRLNADADPDIVEVTKDVVSAKHGLALSACGTIIWGWGTYLGWWCFASVAIWAVFAARDARRTMFAE